MSVVNVLAIALCNACFVLVITINCVEGLPVSPAAATQDDVGDIKSALNKIRLTFLSRVLLRDNGAYANVDSELEADDPVNGLAGHFQLDDTEHLAKKMTNSVSSDPARSMRQWYLG